jgi:hypothetical protein
MKTLKVSDQTHGELTRVAGQLTAESGKIKAYEEAIEALLHRSTLLPPELLHEIEILLETNKQAGYVTKEEFLKEAARSSMEQFNKKHKVAPRN